MPICLTTNDRSRSVFTWRPSTDAFAILGLVSSLLLAAGPALGQITTTSDEDPAPVGSLRAEIEASGAGDTLAVQIDTGEATGRIDLRTTIRFDNDVTIDNSNPAFSAVDIDAPGENSLFEIENDVDVILRDVGIRNDQANRDDDINLQGAMSTLTFDLERADQTVFVDIVGSGSVIKEGTATLELFGINTFTGGLTILDGEVVGDVLSLGTSTIDLAPDAASRTAALVYDLSGFDAISAMGPAITNSSTNGGVVLFSKRGVGSLDISAASIDATIGIRIEQGTIITGSSEFALGRVYDIDAGATLNLTTVLAATTSSSTLTGAGRFLTDPAAPLVVQGDLTGLTGVFSVAAPLLGSTRERAQ